MSAVEAGLAGAFLAVLGLGILLECRHRLRLRRELERMYADFMREQRKREEEVAFMNARTVDAQGTGKSALTELIEGSGPTVFSEAPICRRPSS